ncbi:conjugal transfer protein TraX [Paenibacillus xylanexedens]|uniref:TraX family protein n=1 Tax=Paenibacillus xylanexedens TaxID=528191 RepID=UPI001F3B5465|nr:TraX family protein [Paenibacillus xylanexedens]MCF7758665.1 conjugal transfer protein TraX [Paenibacillus xylanexedens]
MIKILAYVLMVLAHIGYVYYPDSEFLLVIGRLAFPLFAWGISQGFTQTSNFKQYSIRILVIAILSQYPYYLVFGNGYLNVCFTLFVGLLVLKVYELKINVPTKILLLMLFFVITDIVNLEYGMYGIALILAFHIFGISTIGVIVQIIITLLGIYLYHYNPLQIFSVFSFILIILLKNYNFRINYYLNYVFYPVHIVIIYISMYYYDIL